MNILFNYPRWPYFPLFPGSLHGQTPLQKQKNPPEKNPLHLRKWNFIAPILWKVLYFLKRKFFLYFRKRNLALFSPNSKNIRTPPRENLLYFRKREARKKLLYFRKRKPQKENSKKHILMTLLQSVFLSVE